MILDRQPLAAHFDPAALGRLGWLYRSAARVGTLAEGRRGYRPLGRDDPERRLGTSTRSGSGSTIDPYSPGAPTSTGSSSKAPKTRQSRISPAKSFGMVRLFGRTSRDTT
jgi:hypothetical protein